MSEPSSSKKKVTEITSEVDAETTMKVPDIGKYPALLPFKELKTKVEGGKERLNSYLVKRNLSFFDIKNSFIIKLLTFLIYMYFWY